ncbi:hypothetical protein D3C87_624130 [compost metagenome]
MNIYKVSERFAIDMLFLINNAQPLRADAIIGLSVDIHEISGYNIQFLTPFIQPFRVEDIPF